MTGDRRAVVAVLALAVFSGCSTGGSATPQQVAPPAPAATAERAAPPPTPLPSYYIESLRKRAYPGGKLELRDQMFRGPGFTKYQMAWPSGGQVMTGTISIPDGPGPFPVVVVNHGFIPPERYWIGQDSGIFGDPMAAHGFISAAPNWPNYAGSGPAPPDLPALGGELVSALDLVSSLTSLPQADIHRLAFVGHSNGGGVSLLAMVVDPRIKAVVLHAPVGSDMLENGRRWWARRPEAVGPMGSPDANPDAYRHFSPRNYFARGQPPVLIIQGTKDHTITAASTEATYHALQEKGVVSELVWVPEGDHDLVGTDLDNAVVRQEAWIRQALGL